MPYLGTAPATTFISLTSQSFTGGSGTSFTLNKSVSTTSDIAVFVNNVRQSPVNSSYSVSGTTLTMSASIASSDNFYVVFLGSTTGTVNPQAGSVGSTQITAEMITGQTALATEPADTDEFLVSDAGVLKRLDYSNIKGGGKILQVQSAFKSDTASTTSTSDVAITGLSLTLTPSATSSKVLVMFDVGTMGNNYNAHMFFTAYRDIGGGGYNAIGLGTGGSSYNYGAGSYAANGMYHTVGHNFLDSPNTTSQITYKLYFRGSSGSYTYYINRRSSDDLFRGSTSLTCMEVGA